MHSGKIYRSLSFLIRSIHFMHHCTCKQALQTFICIFFQRLRLFGAYALSEMCKSGIDVLDTYPMSVATPLSTDRVHFKAETFFKAMDALTGYSLAELLHPQSIKMCLTP